MKIEQANHYDEALLASINALIPQLSRSAPPLSQSELKAIVESDTTHLLVAYDEDVICGMLTLVVFRIPTGVRSWIEDVVVSEQSRGKGVGHALVEAAVQVAREQGAKTVDLTSRPEREAANRLYRKAGFEQRNTNVYRFAL
ncbi:MAG TPA: GNAT family N-acetyltransferase [Parasulfuritortus sp.]